MCLNVPTRLATRVGAPKVFQPQPPGGHWSRIEIPRECAFVDRAEQQQAGQIGRRQAPITNTLRKADVGGAQDICRHLPVPEIQIRRRSGMDPVEMGDAAVGGRKVQRAGIEAGQQLAERACGSGQTSFGHTRQKTYCSARS